MLSRESILSAADTRLEPVAVPEWGGTVYVPVLSLADLEALAKEQKARTFTTADMAVRVIRDESNQRVFTDADAGELGRKSFRAINRVVSTFNAVNGLGADAAEQAEKN